MMKTFLIVYLLAWVVPKNDRSGWMIYGNGGQDSAKTAGVDPNHPVNVS